jgi:hypothetical protein
MTEKKERKKEGERERKKERDEKRKRETSRQKNRQTENKGSPHMEQISNIFSIPHLSKIFQVLHLLLSVCTCVIFPPLTPFLLFPSFTRTKGL